MITCEKCGKENAEHYKFCLGCGSDISHEEKVSEASLPEPSTPEMKSKDPKGATHQSLRSSVVPPVSPSLSKKGAANKSDEVSCSRCAAQNPPSFKFCGECGFNLNLKEDVVSIPSSNLPKESSESGAKLTLILPDGSEGDVVPLEKGKVIIGRDYGSPFEKDTFLSPKHATFFVEEKKVELQDEHSLNGVYVKILPDKPIVLKHGSMFRVGQEVIQYQSIEVSKPKKGEAQVMGSPSSDDLGLIRLILGRETYGNSLCISSKGMYLGRERGQAIFPEDGYVSALHCRIHDHNGKIVLTDLGSSNGTYTRISEKTALAKGSFILVGQQLFRLDY